MPYASIAKLPSAIRHVLPPHAQDIYRAAFNSSYAANKASARQEEIAHRVAWAAVKRLYVKRGDVWVRRGT
jgi:cation transport regulator